MSRKRKILTFYVSIAGIIIFIITFLFAFIYTAPPSKMKILHAGGKVHIKDKSYSYLNIIDTFSQAYSNGYRYFEYDFVITSDDRLVGAHEYEYLKGYGKSNRILYEEYVTTPILGKFTGVTIENLIPLLERYIDTYIVVDTKETDYVKFYNILVCELERFLPSDKLKNYIKRFIPEIYDKQMWGELKENYLFEQFIFSNYKANYSTNEILKYFSDERIKYISLKKYSFRNCGKIKRNNKKVVFHTVNNKFTAGFLVRFKSAYGFYIDNLKYCNF